ncbi:MAG: hypothetical protein AB8G86_02460 [Saprospiraceae bacterium]
MKNGLILLCLLFIMNSPLMGQINCEDIKEYVETEGFQQSSYCCFDSEFLTGVKFYSLTIEYQTYYYALVQFNFGKWYIYQVPSNSQFNFGLHAFGDQAGEAFHTYIHAYREHLDCAPNLY